MATSMAKVVTTTDGLGRARLIRKGALEAPFPSRLFTQGVTHEHVS